MLWQNKHSRVFGCVSVSHHYQCLQIFLHSAVNPPPSLGTSFSVGTHSLTHRCNLPACFFLGTFKVWRAKDGGGARRTCKCHIFGRLKTVTWTGLFAVDRSEEREVKAAPGSECWLLVDVWSGVDLIAPGGVWVLVAATKVLFRAGTISPRLINTAGNRAKAN